MLFLSICISQQKREKERAKGKGKNRGKRTVKANERNDRKSKKHVQHFVKRYIKTRNQSCQSDREKWRESKSAGREDRGEEHLLEMSEDGVVRRNPHKKVGNDRNPRAATGGPNIPRLSHLLGHTHTCQCPYFGKGAGFGINGNARHVRRLCSMFVFMRSLFFAPIVFRNPMGMFSSRMQARLTF